MKFNYNKLRGRIIEKFGSVNAFAEAYGVSRQTMSLKLNGKVAISTTDIIKMSDPDFLDIPESEFPVYFFDLTLHEMQSY